MKTERTDDQIMACRKNGFMIIEVLLKSGTHTKTKDKKEKTAFDYVTKNENLHVVRN